MTFIFYYNFLQHAYQLSCTRLPRAVLGKTMRIWHLIQFNKYYSHRRDCSNSISYQFVTQTGPIAAQGAAHLPHNMSSICIDLHDNLVILLQTVRVWQRSEGGSYKYKHILDHHTDEVKLYYYTWLSIYFQTPNEIIISSFQFCMSRSIKSSTVA